MINVAVAVPHGGMVHPKLYRSIFAMQQALEGTHSFTYCEVDMASVAKSRCMMVEACLVAGNIDFIHFVDDDIVLPDNAHLLYEHDADIMSGLYMTRQSPHTPQMYRQATEDEYKGKYWPIMDWPVDWVGEVDATGAGCLLVKTGVFRTLHKLWDDKRRACADQLADQGDSVKYFANVGMRLSPWFEFLDVLGEDFYFCERAREAGFRVLVDTRVSCEHLSLIPVSEAHFKDARDRGLIQWKRDK